MSAPLRTLIVDDEAMATERLQLLLCDHKDVQCIGTASDGESALRLISATHPDLILLDISMPGLTGLEVARTISDDREYAPAIIFVTAYDQHAVQAFDLEATDYLLKPVERSRLERAVERARERLSTGKTHPTDTDYVEEFWVSHMGDMVRVPAGQVDHIEAERDYMRLHTGEQSYLLHSTMSSLEERLDPEQFVRTHRSHIFRKDAVRKLAHDGMGAWFVVDGQGRRSRIGRTYLKAVKQIAS